MSLLALPMGSCTATTHREGDYLRTYKPAQWSDEGMAITPRMLLSEIKFAISEHLDTAIEEVRARGSFVTQRQEKALLSRICHASPEQ